MRELCARELWGLVVWESCVWESCVYEKIACEGIIYEKVCVRWLVCFFWMRSLWRWLVIIVVLNGHSSKGIYVYICIYLYIHTYIHTSPTLAKHITLIGLNLSLVNPSYGSYKPTWRERGRTGGQCKPCGVVCSSQPWFTPDNWYSQFP